MFIFKPLLLLCPIVLSLTGSAQRILSGTVVDHDTKEPLSKASVKVAGNSKFAITNEAGSFMLEIPDIKTFDTLVVTHVGYGRYALPISNNSVLTGLRIILRKEVIHLNEVSVYSEFWLKEYSPEELKRDYEKFYTLMEKTHTGLFEYLKNEEWQALKDSSLQLCQYPMTHSEFYRLIALHVGRIRNVHTRHGVTDTWYKQKQNIFPFNVRYFENRLIVSTSLVNDLAFPRGTEIVEINGRTPEQIKSMIWPFIPADGYIETGKTAALNDYFPWFFSLFVEEAEKYIVKLKTLNGEMVTITTPGLKDSFRHLSLQQVGQWKKPALELQIDDTLKTAYFRIEDSRVFKDSIQTYFQRILTNAIQYLIIDLRGGGGMREEEHVVELYSYLVDKPFRACERIEVKSNDYRLFDKDFTFKPYGKSLKHIKEQYFDKLVATGNGDYEWQHESYIGMIQPADKYYAGTIYILVDGRTYSASTDFVSLASQLDNVFVLGEETGGEYRSYISGAMFGLVLPNSKIGVKIPTWRSTLAIQENPSQKGRGAMPDFYVTESLKDFIIGRDAVKDYAYELIRNKRAK